MQITLDKDLQSFVEAQAARDNVTTELWCERKLNALSKKLLRDSLVERIEGREVLELVAYKTAMETAVPELERPVTE